MIDQIADYLAQGMTQADIARILGCAESTISEYVKTEQFKELLADKIRMHGDTRRNKKYDDLEEKALNALRENIPIMDIQQQLRVLETIAKIKNANRIPAANVYNNPTIGVTLIMPAQNIPAVVTDQTNRIVAIGDRTMSPMPINNVKKLFAKLDEITDEKLMPSAAQG